jgi:uncharacterized protein YfaS (alpha-2-macroglobulin family)
VTGVAIQIRHIRSYETYELPEPARARLGKIEPSSLAQRLLEPGAHSADNAAMGGMSMRVRSVVLAVVVSGAAAASGCGPKVKPGLVVTGERLRAKFDRPMVGVEVLGRDLAEGPLETKPKLPGRYVWLDTETLELLPRDALPRSTRVEAAVPAGTRALDGFGIAKAVRWSFETERLRVTFPGAGVTPPEKWAPPDEVVNLLFNQPVRARDVGDRCAYASDRGRVEVAVDESGQTQEARARFRVFPRSPLASATKWRFECDERLTGAEGPLGLVTKNDDGTPANLVAFETFGPFAVASVAPQGAQVPPDEAAIVLKFSSPLAAGATRLPIKIDPPVEGFPGRLSISEDRASMSVSALQPNTRYTITIDAALTDRFNQKLGAPYEASFATGDGTPRLDVETGAWVVESTRAGYAGWARNLTRIEADVAAIPETKLAEVASQLDWWDEQALDTQKAGLRAVHATIPVAGKQNQWQQVAIEPAKLLGSKAPPTGFYYVALRAPEEPLSDDGKPRVDELLLNFTNLGVTAKLAGPSGLVWVTRLSDGQPQPGADVSIRDGKGKVLWRGKTGPDGAAVTPGRAQLQPQKAHPATPPRVPDDGDENEGGEGGEEGEGDFGVRSVAELLVFARSGGDVTWVNPAREGGLAAWNFHVTAGDGTRVQQLRGFLHSDRGLYRPGDTIHVRGLARVMKLGSPLRVPTARKAKVTVRDPRGEEILARNVALSRYGGFSFDVPLSPAARLGDYQIDATLPDGSFRERVAVEQYRTAAFEVKVAPPAREPVAGEDVKLAAEARYLYGAPLKGGDVTWRVYRRTRFVNFPRLPSFEFSDARTWENWWDARSAVGESLVSEEKQRLDGSGRARLELRLEKADFQTAQDLMVTAEVQDESHQTIAANIAVPAHQSGVYFGIDTGSPVVPAGKPHAVRVVAVDPKGNGLASAAKLKVVKHDYSCAWEEWGYHGSYRCDKKEIEVLHQDLALGAAGPVEVRFTPPSPGSYYVIVEGADAAGNATASAGLLWSWGAGDGGWEAKDEERFDLIADQQKYKVGDTAHLLLKTNVHDAKALVTVERDGVIDRRVADVGAGTATIDVPIKPGYGPNVYASVVLVKGRTGKGSRGLPIMRMGLTTLTVDTDDKRLKVAVSTDKPSYRPGESVTARLDVTGADGKPVQAEIALAAADEGVLSLIGFKTPDPLGPFYAPWGLGVSTSTQYERLARLPEPGEARYATGGDQGAPGTFRSRFLATAYWNPAIETDAAGHAQVTFQAPDNLTAYRLMAVAADTGERFGAGDKRITVRKPLQLLSAMPRFLDVGDEVRGGVLVINDTGKAGTAVIDATATGVRLHKGAHQEIALAAGARAPVAFAMRAERPGEIRLRVKAKLGDEEDGLEVRLPVHMPAPVETKLVAQSSTTGAVDLPVKIPEGALPGSATLEVSLDPDGVAGLEEGLRDLIEYPYGCLEQTTSRLIPLVAVEELARGLKLPGLEGPQLQRFIRAGLTKLEGFQTDEGGFSLWMGGKPEPYLTAFALWGLKLASDAGHPLPKTMIPRGVAWLHQALARDDKVASDVDDDLGEMGSRAFAVHVLAMLDSPDAAYATKLLEDKAKMPRYGQAFLARALALNLGASSASVTGLLDDLAGAARPDGAAALIGERRDHDLSWYMSSDLRTTAIATDAFVDLRPSEPLLPKLVRGLLAGRRDGHWDTTQDDLYALVALVHFVKTQAVSDVTVAATLGDKTVTAGPLDGGKVRIRRATVALDVGHPPKAPLHLEATNGTAYYSAIVRYRRDLAHQTAEENGMTIRREYLDPATNEPLDPRKGVKVGGMVRVRVTLSTSDVRSHVAVDDPLPAGLEAVNTKLVTSGGAPKDKGATERGTMDVDEDAWWRPAARELRDDRVLVFMERLWPGPVSFTYLARATTAGTYALPGASVHPMYQPEIGARTAPGTFVVTDK